MEFVIHEEGLAAVEASEVGRDDGTTFLLRMSEHLVAVWERGL